MDSDVSCSGGPAFGLRKSSKIGIGCGLLGKHLLRMVGGGIIDNQYFVKVSTYGLPFDPVDSVRNQLGTI